MAIVDNAFHEWLSEFKEINPNVAKNSSILDTARYAFAAGRKAQRETDAARQPVGQEPVVVEAYAAAIYAAIGSRLRELDWDVAEEELRDAVELAVHTTPLYAAPPAQAVDLGRWSQRHADDLHEAVHAALSVHAGQLSQRKRGVIHDHVKRLLIDRNAGVGNG